MDVLLSPDRKRERPLSVGMRFGFEFVIDEGEMAAFASCSGDRHPIHTDPAYARSRGHPDAVVYGGLMVAKISRLIGMELPRSSLWNGLRIDFRAPLYPREPARLVGEVVDLSAAARALTLKLRITAGSRVIATGTAEVSCDAA